MTGVTGRAQVRFERGTVATPELLQDVDLPASVSVMGQQFDLTPVKARPWPLGCSIVLPACALLVNAADLLCIHSLSASINEAEGQQGSYAVAGPRLRALTMQCPWSISC